MLDKETKRALKTAPADQLFKLSEVAAWFGYSDQHLWELNKAGAIAAEWVATGATGRWMVRAGVARQYKQRIKSLGGGKRLRKALYTFEPRRLPGQS